MQEFIAKYESQIAGVLSGFDRLVFRGTLRKLAYVRGLSRYLWDNHVLLKDFGDHVQRVSQRVKQAAVRGMEAAGRPVEYLASGQTNKEQRARAIMAADRVTAGPVCALTAVEPCQTFEIHRNRQSKHLELLARWRKCLFVYQYWQHPVLGWMNARIQTWFPFAVQICLNGREWLARQMEKKGLAYRQHDNCFPWVESFPEAQQLLQAQLQTEWPTLLNGIADQLNPEHGEIFRSFPVSYYWSTYQSEWATDIAFREAAALKRLYPRFVHHGMTTMHSPDVLRFLGKRLTHQGQIHGSVVAEVTSELRERQEGVRIKHRYDQNSIKLYDKAYTAAGAVLRAEMTLNEPKQFQVYRPREGDPEGTPSWQPMRKGIADLHRRTEVSQKATERYLDAFAHADTTTVVKELLDRVQHPLGQGGKRVRALRPFQDQDRRLLEIVGRGEFTVHGFRNKDLQALLYQGEAASAQESRRRSAAVSRQLRLLRYHRLIRKLPHTYRYQLTPLGRQLIAAVLAARDATVNSLIPNVR